MRSFQRQCPAECRSPWRGRWRRRCPADRALLPAMECCRVRKGGYRAACPLARSGPQCTRPRRWRPWFGRSPHSAPRRPARSAIHQSPEAPHVSCPKLPLLRRPPIARCSVLWSRCRPKPQRGRSPASSPTRSAQPRAVRRRPWRWRWAGRRDRGLRFAAGGSLSAWRLQSGWCRLPSLSSMYRRRRQSRCWPWTQPSRPGCLEGAQAARRRWETGHRPRRTATSRTRPAYHFLRVCHLRLPRQHRHPGRCRPNPPSCHCRNKGSASSRRRAARGSPRSVFRR